MYKESLQNRITRNKKFWTCYLCCHNMTFFEFEKHLLSEKHTQNLKQIDEERKKQEKDIVFTLTKKQRKNIVTNQITFDKSPNQLYCHVCNCVISGLPNTFEHIDSDMHVKNFTNHMKQNNKTIEEKTESVLCNIISNKQSIENILTDQAPIPVLQSKSSSIIYNQHTNTYYCNICKIKITHTPNTSEHMQGSLHQALESELKDSRSSSKSDCIIYDEKCCSFECKICKYKIDSQPNVTGHVQGLLHQTLMQAQAAIDMKIIEGENKDSLSKVALNSEKETVTDNVSINNQDQLLEKLNHKPQFTRICYCGPCQTFMENSTLLKCHVFLHLHEEIDSLQNFDLISFKLKQNNVVDLKCLLCDSVVCKTRILYADRQLENHLKTNKHLNRLLLFNHDKTDLSIPVMNQQMNDINIGSAVYEAKKDISFQLLCNVCETAIHFSNKLQHTSGKNHNNKLAQATVTYTNSIGKTKFDSRKNLTYYSCFICDQSFNQLSNMLKHYQTPEHQWKILSLTTMNKCRYMKFVKKGKLEVILCTSCKLILNDFKTAVDHLLGKSHEEELQLPNSECSYKNNVKTASLTGVTNTFEKLSPATFENESKTLENVPTHRKLQNKKVSELQGNYTELYPDEEDCALVELVTLDFNDIGIRRLPSSAKPKQQKATNQKNAFAMNVLLYGKHYIKFCIDSGVENIYNLDNEKINILKLGLSLTFPYQSNRVCHPCGDQFSDDLESVLEHLQKQEHLDNIKRMEMNPTNLTRKDSLEKISCLGLAKLHMRISDQGIQCHACNVQLSNADKIIWKHVEDLVHKEKSQLLEEQSDDLFNRYLTIYKDIWYYAEYFFCEICNKKYKFEMDFIKHLLHPVHKKKFDKHIRNKVDLTFNLCHSCITYWFGTTNSYEIHCKSDYHKCLVKNKYFMVPDLTDAAFGFINNIDKNTDILVNESNKVKTKEETDKETALLKAIIEAVKPVYPNAEAYTFGSRISHLGFPSSDVDVFVDCENVYYASSTQEKSKEYINSVQDYFKNTPNTWKIDEVLLDTRVPIMKLRHIPTNLKCDISFINGLSVEKSKLVGLYNVALPICRKLILFMKKWLTLCRLFGSDCITTFAISWCVIFYLQLRGVLPTVHELIEGKKQSKIVDGWECGFEELVTAEKSNVSFKEHLKGFFIYFANFDYHASVICPYLGKTIHKRAFAFSDELPIEMNIYKNRLKNNEIEIFRFDSPLCIQDPIDLSQNMTKAVTKQQLRCFRHYCILSAEKC